jgi:hypothetical protein
VAKVFVDNLHERHELYLGHASSKTWPVFLWITFMKGMNYIRGMLEMVCGLPSGFRDRVPLRQDQVLQLATKETRVKNLVDLIFFAYRELDGWWRRRMWIRDGREIMKFKKRVFIYIMNTEVG